MLSNLAIAFASLCLLVGAVGIYNGVSTPRANELLVLGGATLASIGLTTLAFVVKSKLEWRRNYKKYREYHP